MSDIDGSGNTITGTKDANVNIKETTHKNPKVNHSRLTVYIKNEKINKDSTTTTTSSSYKSGSTTIYPTLIACGFRYIPSTKNVKLHFPAWLIQFYCNDTKSFYYQWRSKLDFLKLNRSLQKVVLCSNSNTTGNGSTIMSKRQPKKIASTAATIFPKKSLEKLSSSLIVNCNSIHAAYSSGWIVPLENENIVNEVVRSIGIDKAEVDMLIQSFVQNNVCKRNSSSSNTCKELNIYHPTMYKSIQRMNQFLQLCHSTITSNADIGTSNRFSSSKDNMDHLNDNNELLSLFSNFRQSWKSFGQKEDNVNSFIILQEPSCTNNKDLHKMEGQDSDMVSDCSNNTALSPSSLGQYFASDEIVQCVIDSVHYYIQQLQHKTHLKQGSARSGQASDNNNLKYVLIEPSCGDGRILTPLASTTINNNLNDCSVILGYDIDPRVILKCSNNPTLQPYLKSKQVSIYCRNFLSLTRDDVHHAISTTTTTSIPINTEEITALKDKNTFTDLPLIFVGGPPYSSSISNNINTNNDSNSQTDRSLPRKFIFHCIQNLNATIVIFILPNRCKKQLKDWQSELNHQRLKKDESSSSCCSNNNRSMWKYAVKELPNSSFFYNGVVGKMVIQPSFLLTFNLEEENK